MDIDECLSDDSDLSFDHISLQEKSLSVRSSQSQLTSMDEVYQNLHVIFIKYKHSHYSPILDKIKIRRPNIEIRG